MLSKVLLLNSFLFTIEQSLYPFLVLMHLSFKMAFVYSHSYDLCVYLCLHLYTRSMADSFVFIFFLSTFTVPFSQLFFQMLYIYTLMTFAILHLLFLLIQAFQIAKHIHSIVNLFFVAPFLFTFLICNTHSCHNRFV